MKQATVDSWIASLNNGDIGLLRSNNFFATLQNWRRKKYKEGELFASHGFYIYHPPSIMESNGLFVSQGKLFKNIGGKTEVWIFRYGKITKDQVEDMNIYWEAMREGGAHYSIMGIAQFATQFLGVRKKITDASGVFCTEGTGKAIVKAEIPYITLMHANVKDYEVDPSMQLNWFMSEEARQLGWYLACYYDGKGGYFVS